MKKSLLIMSIWLLAFGVQAQIAGNRDIPSGNYPTIQSAFDSLNTYGVGPGGVTFHIQGGYVENITAPLQLTATGTASNPISFLWDGTGSKPQIIRTDAGTISTSTTGGYGDAIIRLDGSDYVTISGLYLKALNQGIEYGILTHKPAGTNGCQNITISNCKIEMNKGTSAYVAGIYIGNGTTSPSSATGVTVTSNSGKNKNISLSYDTIFNAQMGIYVRGYNSTTYYDSLITISYCGVYNYGAASGASTYGAYFIYVQDPSVVNSDFVSAKHTSTLYGVFFSTVSGIIHCNFNNFFLKNTSNSSSTYYIYNGNTVSSESYISNTFRGDTISSTGSVYFIYSSNATLNKSIVSNRITYFNRSATSGNVYGYYNLGNPTGGTEYLYNNDFANIQLSGSSGFYGIYTFTATGHNRSIVKNNIHHVTCGTGTFYGINVNTANTCTLDSNEVHDIDAGGTTYGYYFASIVNGLVRSNKAFNISSSGASVYGFYISSGTTYQLSQNSVHGIVSTNTNPTVDGIYVNASTQLVNNFVSELYAPNTSNNTNAVRGVDIGSSASNVKLYYNTIYLDAYSLGALSFGTSALFANTTPTLELINNIIIDKSTPQGSGYSVAYRRSSTTLSTYASSSNNNIFYADTSASSLNNLIFYDGTNSIRNFDNYKLFVTPRDDKSYLELTPFINSNTQPYDLHIDATIATFAEGNGTPISGWTKDFDNNDRDPISPDIGADEFNGTPRYTCSAPSSESTNASNTNICLGDVVTLSIPPTPGSGVVYQWQISHDGTTYTDIPGAYSYSLNTAPTEPAYYRAFTMCKKDSSYAYSTPVFIDFANKILSVQGDTICGAHQATLLATGTSGSTIAWFTAPTGGILLDTGNIFTTPTLSADTQFYAAAVTLSPTNVTIGSGASTSSSYESPFYHLFGGLKTQYLIPANELTAAGLSAGPIYSISFEVVTVGTTYQDLTVSMGTTTNSTMSTSFITSLTPVYTTSAFTPVAGINTITFSTPFNWNGSSNLVVEFCWSNNNSGGTSTTVKYDNTSYVSEAYYRADNTPASTLCAQTTANNTLNRRPKFTFNSISMCSSLRVAVPVHYNEPPVVTITTSRDTICNGQEVTLVAQSSNPDYTYLWLPDSITGTTADVTPHTSTNFVVEATDPNTGCHTSAHRYITVGNVFSTINSLSATPDVVCAGALIDLAASYSHGITIVPDTILHESFESGSIPSGWTQQLDDDGNGTSATFYVQGSSTNPTGFSPTDGTYLLRFNSFSILSGNKARLYTTINSYHYHNLKISFDWTKDGGYSSRNDRVIVQYSFDQNNWTSIDSIFRYGTPNHWEHVTYNLPAVVEDTSFYIGFLFVSEYGNDCHVDNIKVYGDRTDTIYSSIIYWTSSPSMSLPNSANIEDIQVNQTTQFTFHVTNMYHCETTSDVTVTVMNAPAINITATANPICEGSSTLLTASSSHTGYVYNWSTGVSSASIDVTPISTSIYSVTAFDNTLNCSTTGSITINVIPYPVINFPDSLTLYINHDTVLNAGNPGASYLWVDLGSGQTLGTSQTLTVGSNTPGSQSIQITVTNGGLCSVSDTIIITYIVSLREYNYGMKIYPNPTADKINVAFSNLPTGSYIFEIISNTGSTITRESIQYDGKPIQLNLATYPAGTYTLRIVGNNDVLNVPIMIMR